MRIETVVPHLGLNRICEYLGVYESRDTTITLCFLSLQGSNMGIIVSLHLCYKKLLECTLSVLDELLALLVLASNNFDNELRISRTALLPVVVIVVRSNEHDLPEVLDIELFSMCALYRGL